jgi:ABC-type transport system substrate-binding protein
MYYLSSGMFSPVPAEFIEALGNDSFAEGVKAWGNKTDSGLSPVDTWLSTGPYTIERWDTDQQIVFKKNPNYTLEGANRYQIAGVHMNILTAAASDPLAALKEFEANKLHSCGIPLQKLSEYKDDPRTTTTVGSSTFKLNFNSCTQDEWVKLFGVNGSITKTEESKYWSCEPFMSNDDFLKGLSYAINRADFAATIGRTPSNDYFGSGYLSDPENGIMYNQTQYHKDAMAELSEGTNFGYNLEFAKASFKKAADALIAEGKYKAGDTVTIEVAWMYPTDKDEYHAIIKKYIEDAWNASNTGLKLNVEFWVGNEWSDVYYVKMMKGQFDIGFGSISGNTLNPLNFFEVLRSDNSSGFTLNWGCDTSVVSEEIYYDGMYWSFDSLWTAADQGGYFEKGQVSAPVQAAEVIEAADYVENADGSITISFACAVSESDDFTVTLNDVVVWGYIAANNANGYAYNEVPVSYELADGVMTVTISAETVALMRDTTVSNDLGDLGIDVLYTLAENVEGGLKIDGLTTTLFQYVMPEAE